MGPASNLPHRGISLTLANLGYFLAAIQDEASDLHISSAASPLLSPGHLLMLHWPPSDRNSSDLPLHNGDHRNQHLFSPVATTLPHQRHLPSNRHIAPGSAIWLALLFLGTMRTSNLSSWQFCRSDASHRVVISWWPHHGIPRWDA